jgi:hypothetical protein
MVADKSLVLRAAGAELALGAGGAGLAATGGVGAATGGGLGTTVLAPSVGLCGDVCDPPQATNEAASPNAYRCLMTGEHITTSWW